MYLFSEENYVETLSADGDCFVSEQLTDIDRNNYIDNIFTNTDYDIDDLAVKPDSAFCCHPSEFNVDTCKTHSAVLNKDHTHKIEKVHTDEDNSYTCDTVKDHTKYKCKKKIRKTKKINTIKDMPHEIDKDHTHKSEEIKTAKNYPPEIDKIYSYESNSPNIDKDNSNTTVISSNDQFVENWRTDNIKLNISGKNDGTDTQDGKDSPTWKSVSNKPVLECWGVESDVRGEIMYCMGTIAF